MIESEFLNDSVELMTYKTHKTPPNETHTSFEIESPIQTPQNQRIDSFRIQLPALLFCA